MCQRNIKRYSRPCLPLLWPRLYAEPFGLGEKRRPANAFHTPLWLSAEKTAQLRIIKPSHIYIYLQNLTCRLRCTCDEKHICNNAVRCWCRVWRVCGVWRVACGVWRVGADKNQRTKNLTILSPSLLEAAFFPIVHSHLPDITQCVYKACAYLKMALAAMRAAQSGASNKNRCLRGPAVLKQQIWTVKIKTK